MPTYSYRCTDCDHEFEIVQAITDGALTTCPQCQGALRKVFHPVGVAFKGSGFYRTDSRPDSGKEAAASAAKTGDGAKTSDGGGSDAKAPSKSSDGGSSSKSSDTKSSGSGASGSGSTSGSSGGGSGSSGSGSASSS